MRWTQNKFIRSLGISIVIAFGMVSATFGAINLFVEGGNPVPLPVLLMAFAIVFVLGSVFFEERGADRIGALIGGGIAAAVVSLVLVLICGGVIYLLIHATETGVDKIASMIAVCMVIGMAALNYSTHHLRARR
ncbi:MAG TPA: hypothetical protein EYP67_02975 [Methanosarcinales archaeon]|nr:hypothetical protein [Methanosarcinales archaeon]